VVWLDRPCRGKGSQIAKGFLNAASILNLILSSPSGIAKHAQICIQFANSAGNFGAGTLIKQHFLFVLPEFFLFC
jgi:hypothetical protein